MMPAWMSPVEAELRADPKENAEHVMLVDLARNDLGRVAAPAAYMWTRTGQIERYSHVMHIVSGVHGRLRAGKRRVRPVRGHLPGRHPGRRAQGARHADHR